jgi:hypothetical protein
MIGDAGDGVLSFGLAAEKVANVIRHLYQVL